MLFLPPLLTDINAAIFSCPEILYLLIYLTPWLILLYIGLFFTRYFSSQASVLLKSLVFCLENERNDCVAPAFFHFSFTSTYSWATLLISQSIFSLAPAYSNIPLAAPAILYLSMVKSPPRVGVVFLQMVILFIPKLHKGGSLFL